MRVSTRSYGFFYRLRTFVPRNARSAAPCKAPQSPARTRIRAVTALVNTHSDGDYWWGNQEVKGAEIVATEAAAKVMAEQSPGEMKRFGLPAGALRLAGSMPITYPRRDDVAVIAASVGRSAAAISIQEVAGAVPADAQAVLDGAAAAGAKLVFADNLYIHGPPDDRMTEETPQRAQGRKGRTR